MLSACGVHDCTTLVPLPRARPAEEVADLPISSPAQVIESQIVIALVATRMLLLASVTSPGKLVSALGAVPAVPGLVMRSNVSRKEVRDCGRGFGRQ